MHLQIVDDKRWLRFLNLSEQFHQRLILTVDCETEADAAVAVCSLSRKALGTADRRSD